MSTPFARVVIRPSTLSGYPDCPRRAAARLHWRTIKAAGFTLRWLKRNVGAVVGSAVHAAAAEGFRIKARTGELPGASQVVDVGVHELDAGLRDEIEWDGPKGSTHSRNDAEHQVAAIARKYWQVVAPTVHPMAVEERFEAWIDDGVLLSGQPDIVCREPGSVRDLKTGARLGNHAPQVGAYSLLSRSHGVDIESVSIDWLPRVAVKKPQPDPVSVSINVTGAEVAAASIIKHIQSDLFTFEHGDADRRILPGDPWAFLANPASKLCSAKWCPAYDTPFCREGKDHHE